MSFLSQNTHWPRGGYYQYSPSLLRSIQSSLENNYNIRAMDIINKVARDTDESTEVLNEAETTDLALGDVTLEIMVTTTGKIPSEMYDLDDTTVGANSADNANDADAIGKKSSDSGFAAHSTLFLILGIALLLLLFLCCIAACLISRAKKRGGNIFSKENMDCDPECTGISQPLLRSDKASETTNKTSVTSLKK